MIPGCVFDSTSLPITGSNLTNYNWKGIGGPKLIYDHQLALDSNSQILYVHGGRVVDGDWNTPKFSGMYSYDLRSGKWTNIQCVDSNVLVRTDFFTSHQEPVQRIPASHLDLATQCY